MYHDQEINFEEAAAEARAEREELESADLCNEPNEADIMYGLPDPYADEELTEEEEAALQEQAEQERQRAEARLTAKQRHLREWLRDNRAKAASNLKSLRKMYRKGQLEAEHFLSIRKDYQHLNRHHPNPDQAADLTRRIDELEDEMYKSPPEIRAQLRQRAADLFALSQAAKF